MPKKKIASAARAAARTMIVDLASVLIAHKRSEVAIPEQCPGCKKPLHGEEGVGVSEVYFEMRIAYGSLRPAKGDDPGGFVPGGDSETAAAQRPEHPHALCCTGCGYTLVGRPLTLIGADDRVEQNAKTVGQLMAALSRMDPEALVILSSDDEGNDYKPLESVDFDEARVTGDSWRAQVEFADEGTKLPETKPAVVLFPHS
jgi:hypothetical protein